jgi:hypothetical protein
MKQLLNVGTKIATTILGYRDTLNLIITDTIDVNACHAVGNDMLEIQQPHTQASDIASNKQYDYALEPYWVIERAKQERIDRKIQLRGMVDQMTDIPDE